MLLKISTARNRMFFLIASSDHRSGLAGATLTITSSKDGAAFAGIVPTVTDRGDGWYKVELTAGMTDTIGDLAFHVTAASADPIDMVDQVVLDLPSDPSVLLDYADGIETGYTLRQTLRLIGAVCCAKVSGGPGSPVFRNLADAADRVTMTATSAGNRTAVTLTP